MPARKKVNDETEVQEEGSTTQEVEVVEAAFSAEEQALLAMIEAENASVPDQESMDEALAVLANNQKLSDAAKNFPVDKIPETHIRVKANRRFGQIDPGSKRGISKTIPGANGTNVRMVAPGEYAIIRKETARNLQKSGAVDIDF
jgi:hypothetical protein